MIVVLIDDANDDDDVNLTAATFIIIFLIFAFLLNEMQFENNDSVMTGSSHN